MTACRSGDPSTRLAAVQATRTMADLCEDEDSPHSEQNMSYIGFCNTMDEVEQALLVGQQLAAVASSSNQPTGSSSSVHVDRVALVSGFCRFKRSMAQLHPSFGIAHLIEFCILLIFSDKVSMHSSESADSSSIFSSTVSFLSSRLRSKASAMTTLEILVSYAHSD